MRKVSAESSASKRPKKDKPSKAECRLKVPCSEAVSTPPGDSHGNFVELLSWMTKPLESHVQHRIDSDQGNIYDIVRKEDSCSIALPFITTLRDGLLASIDTTCSLLDRLGLCINGAWCDHETTRHINYLELLAVLKAFRSFKNILWDHTVQIVSDNIVTVLYKQEDYKIFNHRSDRLDLPIAPKGHSTGAAVASSVLSARIPMHDICRVATWSTPCTFTRHYRLDVRARGLLLRPRSPLFSSPVMMPSRFHVWVSEHLGVAGLGTESLPGEGPCQATLVAMLGDIFKFLTLCVASHPGRYPDRQRVVLLAVLCRLSLDRNLGKQLQMELQQLLLVLLEGVQDWQEKLPELCRSLCHVSQHHHNLVAVVRAFADTTARGRLLIKFADDTKTGAVATTEEQGPKATYTTLLLSVVLSANPVRQLRGTLSLCIIMKLLGKMQTPRLHWQDEVQCIDQPRAFRPSSKQWEKDKAHLGHATIAASWDPRLLAPQHAENWSSPGVFSWTSRILLASAQDGCACVAFARLMAFWPCHWEQRVEPSEMETAAWTLFLACRKLQQLSRLLPLMKPARLKQSLWQEQRRRGQPEGDQQEAPSELDQE
ncbi:hypothetical protein EYD10_11377, partial [Varanus komodoensis]